MHFYLLEILKFTQEHCGFVELVYQIRNFTMFRKHCLKVSVSSKFWTHALLLLENLLKKKKPSNVPTRDETIAFYGSEELTSKAVAAKK